jgi:hypothetical protein
VGCISRTAAFFDFFHEGKVRMNKTNYPVDRIKIGFGIALLAVLTGCVGYVGGGYGGPVVVPGPSVYFWGGDYDRGREVHVYSQRGYESRAVVHRGGH